MNNYPFFLHVCHFSSKFLRMRIPSSNSFHSSKRTIARFTARSSILITVTAKKLEEIFVSKGRYTDTFVESFADRLRGKEGCFRRTFVLEWDRFVVALKSGEKKKEREKGKREENTLRWRKEIRSNGAFTSWKFQVLFQGKRRGREDREYILGISIDRKEFMKASSYSSLSRPRNNYHPFKPFFDLTNSPSSLVQRFTL